MLVRYGNACLRPRSHGLQRFYHNVDLWGIMLIGLLKNRYTILQGTLPVTNLKRKQDTDTSFIDRVLVVCSALVNMSPSVVPR